MSPEHPDTLPESITLLHISDIQFGRNHRFGNLTTPATLEADASFDTLFERISADLTLLAKDAVFPDVIAVTGDLAEWGERKEMEDALTFLNQLSTHTGVPKTRVFLVPGNHDINRKLSEGYVLTCEGNGEEPIKPYWPKWKHFAWLMDAFYGSEPSSFSESQPWTFFEVPELRLAIAGINSTMVDNHEEDSHYGYVGEDQLRWFAEVLAGYRDRGWLRIGLIHHNLQRGAVSDDENLRDADDFRRITGGLLNVVLHGHVHKQGLEWIDSAIPVFSTGSAALTSNVRPKEIPNQYQLIRFTREGFERWTRCYDPGDKRWIADTRSSEKGDTGHTKRSVAFSYVHGTLRETTKAEAIDATPGDNAANLIVRVDEPLSPSVAKQRLQNLRRFLLIPEGQHRAIRAVERRKMIDALRNFRSAWLVCDWGFGKEGFIASVLETYGSDSLSSVYRLHCGEAQDCDQLLALAETQLGLSFQEFAAAVAALSDATLVFDDVPTAIAAGLQREVFERKIKPLFDFGPNVKMVFVTRQTPRLTKPEEIIALASLDVPEVREYLRQHTKAVPNIDSPEDLERIHEWSGGLPMHIDRLLERMPFLPLSDILSEEAEAPVGSAWETPPETLKRVVSELEQSADRDLRQSFDLLKVLTVLKDGETYDSIRRFFRTPFRTLHIDILDSRALLERVPISQTGAELHFKFGRSTIKKSDPPKLLRIPKQVRDYVNSLIRDEERSDIIATSMDLFFGRRWWKGDIRLRTTIQNAYGHSAIPGPGNEHVVARLMLARAIEKRNRPQMERYARLALTYCEKLLRADRFRDAVIASGAILDLLRDTNLDKYFVELQATYGEALRMTGKLHEAIEALTSALEKGAETLSKEIKSEIYTDLALAYKSVGKRDEAIKAANSVIDLGFTESNEAYNAKAILAELTLGGNERRERLIVIEQEARNHKRGTAANNVALDLAKTASEPKESLRWLEKVISTARDPYNRTRAIVEKASVMGSHLRAASLSDEDYRMLSAAYSYSYAQRIENLLDRCHNVLWGVFRRGGLFASLLRLFRFSSFIWRIRGSNEEEDRYLGDLKDVDVAQLEQSEGRALEIEIHYLQRRRQDRMVWP